MRQLFLSFFCMLVIQGAVLSQTAINLGGSWRVKLDSLDQGINERWFEHAVSKFPFSLSLPGTLDDAGIGNPVSVQPVLTKEVMTSLHRKVSYTGAAWYSRSFTIPQGKPQSYLLFLERVLWTSQVWIDGKKIGEVNNSLVAPHTVKTSLLEPGEHIIVIRIDNSKLHDISVGDRNMAHAYTDGTQIIWNGIIGKLELKPIAGIYVQHMRVFPDTAGRKLRIQLTVVNESGANSTLYGALVGMEKQSRLPVTNEVTLSYTAAPGISVIDKELPTSATPRFWSEFDPVLYTAEFRMQHTANSAETVSTTFAWRTLSTSNALLQLNGKRLFLRGTLECAIFPLTGYPPMKKEGWLKILQSAKNYGLNHLRFHSWCPPTAAFDAADELGMYLQVELPVWSLRIGKIGSATQWMEEEADRIVAHYGNHPSFCFFSMGNELEGNFNVLRSLIEKLKAKDRRRLYTSTSFTFQQNHGKWPEPQDDFFITQYTDKGWVRGQGIFDQESPHFNKDYRAAVEGMKVPLITHEIGQYAVYPNLEEISKYKGVLKPVNFEAVKADLLQKDMLPLAHSYLMASGKLATLLYKEEIERALKTPNSSGYQLLDLHDFPGQGTALVGVLDAFWDSKGVVSANSFKQFSGEVVPLLRFEKAVYETDETFEASIEIANFSAAEISKKDLNWTITTSNGKQFKSGNIKPASLPLGNSGIVGNISVPLKKIQQAEELRVTVRIGETSYENSWSIWVYPKSPKNNMRNVVSTGSIDEALAFLEQGKTVLFNPPLEQLKGVDGKFVQVFWSPVHFPDQPGTMGLLIDSTHRAFHSFPTNSHSNWQWWDLCKSSKTMVLDSTGIAPEAIVLRNIDNFFRNRTMASLIEAKIGKGKLIFSSMDITNALSTRPAARQLRNSLVDYMNSDAFDPKITLTAEQLKSLIF